MQALDAVGRYPPQVKPCSTKKMSALENQMNLDATRGSLGIIDTAGAMVKPVSGMIPNTSGIVNDSSTLNVNIPKVESKIAP